MVSAVVCLNNRAMERETRRDRTLGKAYTANAARLAHTREGVVIFVRSEVIQMI